MGVSCVCLALLVYGLDERGLSKHQRKKTRKHAVGAVAKAFSQVSSGWSGWCRKRDKVSTHETKHATEARGASVHTYFLWFNRVSRFWVRRGRQKAEITQASKRAHRQANMQARTNANECRKGREEGNTESKHARNQANTDSHDKQQHTMNRTRQERTLFLQQSRNKTKGQTQ